MSQSRSTARAANPMYRVCVSANASKPTDAFDSWSDKPLSLEEARRHRDIFEALTPDFHKAVIVVDEPAFDAKEGGDGE